jgi:hypothetical protein
MIIKITSVLNFITMNIVEFNLKEVQLELKSTTTKKSVLHYNNKNHVSNIIKLV